jgi:hypothetical protein
VSIPISLTLVTPMPSTSIFNVSPSMIRITLPFVTPRALGMDSVVLCEKDGVFMMCCAILAASGCALKSPLNPATTKNVASTDRTIMFFMVCILCIIIQSPLCEPVIIIIRVRGVNYKPKAFKSRFNPWLAHTRAPCCHRKGGYGSKKD